MPDVLTPEQRRRSMRSNKAKDTSIEKRLRAELHGRGRRFRIHVSRLPGTPDIVFPRVRVAVFVDEYFWHGYDYPAWKHKLTGYWREKIETNRKRDRRNFASLRRKE